VVTPIEGAAYAKGKNEKEADYVARKIIEHAKRWPKLSLGVGTLNIKQRELIEDQLDKLTKEDVSANFAIEKLMKAHDGSEPLFIKNLENLQGDQRDVIFISCTYGPDRETGHVFQRLRDEMIRRFVKVRPTSKNKYIDAFSVSLRVETEPEENQYLENIFAIIEQAEGLECMV